MPQTDSSGSGVHFQEPHGDGERGQPLWVTEGARASQFVFGFRAWGLGFRVLGFRSLATQELNFPYSPRDLNPDTLNASRSQSLNLEGFIQGNLGLRA